MVAEKPARALAVRVREQSGRAGAQNRHRRRLENPNNHHNRGRHKGRPHLARNLKIGRNHRGAPSGFRDCRTNLAASAPLSTRRATFRGRRHRHRRAGLKHWRELKRVTLSEEQDSTS